MSENRNLEFLYEMGTLRYMPRGWVQTLGGKPASVLEHTVRVVFLALAISRREGKGDEAKIIKMALAHDLAEARTTDHGYISKVYVKADEEKAVHDQLAGTLFEDFEQVIHEYEQRKCIEAKIVKDADNLDIDLEMKEFEEQGHRLPKKWEAIRKKVRDEKLYTESARLLWDEIQKSDAGSWHLLANKYYLIPDAGL